MLLCVQIIFLILIYRKGIMIQYIIHLLRALFCLPFGVCKKNNKKKLRISKQLFIHSLIFTIVMVVASTNRIVKHLIKWHQIHGLSTAIYFMGEFTCQISYMIVIVVLLLRRELFIRLCNVLLLLNDQGNSWWVLSEMVIVLVMMLVSVAMLVETDIWFGFPDLGLVTAHRLMTGILLVLLFSEGIRLTTSYLNSMIEDTNFILACKTKTQDKIDGKTNTGYQVSRSLLILNHLELTPDEVFLLFGKLNLIDKCLTLLMECFKFPILIMIIYDCIEIILSFILIFVSEKIYPSMYSYEVTSLCRITLLLKAPNCFLSRVSYWVYLMPIKH